MKGVEECAAGVEVVLKQDGREVGRATTDTFGEFKFDKLEPNSGGYQLEATGLSGALLDASSISAARAAISA